MTPIIALVTDEMVDNLARYLCASRNEDPDGTEANLGTGEVISFLDKAKRDVRVILARLDSTPAFRH